MTPEQFCYWLQGRAELVAGPPDAAQWASIVAHLSLVFQKATPLGPGELTRPVPRVPAEFPAVPVPGSIPPFPQWPDVPAYPVSPPTLIC